MKWPEFEGREKIPVGHYQFRLNREPELKAFTYKNKDGEEKQGRKVVIYAVGLNDTGSYSVRDNIVAWEERYRDLLEALRVEHGKDIEMEGAVFEADIVYEADQNVPSSRGIADDIPFD